MYITDTGRRSVSPARELSDNVSEAGSSGRRVHIKFLNMVQDQVMRL